MASKNHILKDTKWLQSKLNFNGKKKKYYKIYYIL